MKLKYLGIRDLLIITKKRNKYKFTNEDNVVDVKDYDDIYEILGRFGGKIIFFFEDKKADSKLHFKPAGITTTAGLGNTSKLEVSVNTPNGTKKLNENDILKDIEKAVSKKKSTKKQNTKSKK